MKPPLWGEGLPPASTESAPSLPQRGRVGEGETVGEEETSEKPTLPLDGLEELEFGPEGVIPAIAQDVRTREVLIPGFVNKEMLRRTLETGKAWFWSRSRQAPWLKGETSGNYLFVREVRRNCDDNAVLYLCEPVGPACHTGEVGCFYRRLDGTKVEQVPGYGPAAVATDGGAGGASAAGTTAVAGAGEAPAGAAARYPGTLDWLFEVLRGRQVARPDGSYVVKLLDQGVDRIAKKVGEEAAEVIIAAKNRSVEELAYEMGDLWFHSLVLLLDAGMTPEDVYRSLAARHRPTPRSTVESEQ